MFFGRVLVLVCRVLVLVCRVLAAVPEGWLAGEQLSVADLGMVVSVRLALRLAAALQPSYSLLDGAKPLLEAYRSIPRPLNRVLFPCAYFFKRIHDRRTLLHMQRREEQRLAGRPPPAAPRRRGLAGAAQNALVPAAIYAGTSALLFLAAGLLHSPGADAPGSLAPAKSPSVQRGHR